jgi:ribosomal protein L40E
MVHIANLSSMKLCPYCGYANNDNATQCRKCDGPLAWRPTTYLSPKSYWIGPEKARRIRDKALAVVVLGLLIKVYWGGYGPWPVIDYAPLAHLRLWLEPLLLYAGGAGYLVGWVLSRV